MEDARQLVGSHIVSVGEGPVPVRMLCAPRDPHDQKLRRLAKGNGGLPGLCVRRYNGCLVNVFRIIDRQDLYFLTWAATGLPALPGIVGVSGDWLNRFTEKP